MSDVPTAGAKRRVLVIGADLVMPKLFYFADELAKLGFGYTIYTHDVSPETRAVAAQAGATFIAGPPHRKSIVRMLTDAWRLMTQVRRRDYHHADLYCDYHILAAFMYLLILRAKGIPVVLWCRGELYDWPVFGWWQKLFFRVAIALSRLVILKERYMIDTLTRAGIYRPEKSIELHNSVPVDDWQRPAVMPQAEVRLLFLNSFKLWRNVGFCVDVADALRRAGTPFAMTIVGDKHSSQGLTAEGEALRAEIERRGLGAQVQVEGFSEDPLGWYRAHDIFLLPADLIYCNYALLEAMREGLVPIVYDKDRDFALIVEDGVSGYGRPLDADAWAEAIAELVVDRAKAAAMSAAAATQIRQNFAADRLFRKYALHSGLIADYGESAARVSTVEKAA